jgi:kynurenine formamidase
MLQAMEAVLQKGRVIDLAQVMKQGMPTFPAHVPFSFTLNVRHTDFEMPGGLGVANDVINGCTHSGTHIDAIGHFSKNGCIHGGHDIHHVATGPGGLLKQGIEQTPPIVRRGVLFDVAAYKDREMLEPGYAITAQDLENTAKAQGIELRAGDVALIRTGCGKLWDTPERYMGAGKGFAGPDLGAAQWLVRNGVSFTGADNCTYEFNSGDGGGTVHGFLLAERGVQIIENLNLEALAAERIHTFLFFAAPLKIVGATGSPIRPVAVC